MNELLDLLISQAMVGASLWVQKHKLEGKLSTAEVALELAEVMKRNRRKISLLALVILMNQGKNNQSVETLGKSLAYKMGVDAARGVLGRLVSVEA